MRRIVKIVLLLVIVLWPRSERAWQPAAFAYPLPDQTPASEPLALVVNHMNSLDNLAFTELRKIFLGSQVYWPDGRRITLVMREPGEPERKTILHDVCGMNEDQFKTHFLSGLYRGEILVSPKTLASSAGVRKFVFNVPGAIGYLRMSEVDSSVKVLRIDEVFPEDKSYKLRVARK